jgi:hypothetical protein
MDRLGLSLTIAMNTQMLISQAPPLPRIQVAAEASIVPAIENTQSDSSAEADLSVWYKLYSPCPSDTRFRRIKTPAIFEP